MSLPQLNKKWDELKGRAWPALGVLLILPGAGALGAHTYEAQQAAGLNMNVGYQSEAHIHVATHWVITPTGFLRPTGRYSIRVEKADLNNFELASITPNPLAIRQEVDGDIYTFTGTTTSVDFTLLPKKVGKTAATLQFGVDSPVGFSVTTLP